MNNLNIDESSVQSIEKVKFKKIFGKWCLTNSSETEILTFAVKRCKEIENQIEKIRKEVEIIENFALKRCKEIENQIEKIRKEVEIIENDLRIMQKPQRT